MEDSDMKIPSCEKSYDEVMALPRAAHEKPHRPNLFFRTLIRVAGAGGLRRTHFTYTGAIPKKEGPYLILMNHSCFLDLSIAAKILYPMPYCTVCTSDGFVGKKRLMRSLGCIPTKKFVTDLDLVRDLFAVLRGGTGVLLFPEASYSFDGCATPLPRRMGALLKRLDVPVAFIRTHGAFLHDPLYNGLQLRDVRVSAEARVLLTREQIASLSVAELDAVLDDAFSFDHFAEQLRSGTRISEPFRADGLNRVLYRCPACGTEGRTRGAGTVLRCEACGKEYELLENGQMRARTGITEYPHIPDWYAYERRQVIEELQNGTYRLDIPVRIGMIVDTKSLYFVGNGRLVHTAQGFHLTGCDGKLDYMQKPDASYGLYADYYWYEIADMICIGNTDRLYYCFPQTDADVVAKTRLAAEELYKMTHRKTVSALSELSI